MQLLFANNAQSTLAGAISDSALTANLAPGTGVFFPAPTLGAEYFVGTFTDAATGLLNEVVWVTQVVGDTITMLRAQEGTTALAWDPNDLFAELWTAGQAATLVQEADAQAQPWNYAVDAGSTNAYQCTLDPPLTAHVNGMPIRVKIANPNTTTTPTFNPGPGAVTIISQNGSVVQPGQINGICEFKYNGSEYEVSQISGNTVTRVVAQLVTATGTYTPTPGMLYVDVICYGGGGGGGGAKSAAHNSGGGGGGSGARSRATLTATQIGASKAVTIGAGGAGGISTGGNGVAGGDTSLGVLVIAKGGSAGQGRDGSTIITSNPGTGGLASTGTGTFKHDGVSGGIGFCQEAPALYNGGYGGGEGGGKAQAGDMAGATATGVQGGGGAGASNSSGVGYAGGDGAPGSVEIIEYIG